MKSIVVAFACLMLSASQGWSLSSANIPLDSPVYSYLDKLAGFGLISSDIKGIKPFSKAEAARMLLEAEKNLAAGSSAHAGFAEKLVGRIRKLIPREVAQLENPDKKPRLFDYNPMSSLRLRYIWLDGVPRNYSRAVHDPGDDGVFGIGSSLRPENPYPFPVQQRGSEGTPLLENNNGVVHGDGHSGELRWGSEWYLGGFAAAMLEPSVQADGDDTRFRLNRGYLKLGGGALELEAGKDENWLGLGYRGNITLTNNAENFTQVKISSPEPFDVKYVGAMKYTVIASRFEKSTVGGVERQPWFYAVKLSAKPTENLEVGFNLGRQVGGPGVKNSLGDSLRGLIGGTASDNSNGLAGFEARYRMPWLRNTELYGEFSGEDTALFWPIVESYVAGLYIPRLTDDGRNDFRFEFFQGNQILYTGMFPAGYIYKGMPIGHSQGGATQDFFFRGSHWFSVRNNLALEYIYTNRGVVGRIPVAGVDQAIEKKHAGRVFWSLPLTVAIDGQLGYGIEKTTNLNLVDGVERTNQLVKFELRYRY
ncbi:MAG: capsule assembly Wzi family protein [Geobacteraceae bacterium]|nr:capsule assembly Wzi family protein [Geobacteraceae bacterium]NTW79516.1 capsule assembly Wzi family protein [Geobacteraceae bacterium]